MWVNYNSLLLLAQEDGEMALYGLIYTLLDFSGLKQDFGILEKR